MPHPPTGAGCGEDERQGSGHPQGPGAGRGSWPGAGARACPAEVRPRCPLSDSGYGLSSVARDRHLHLVSLGAVLAGRPPRPALTTPAPPIPAPPHARPPRASAPVPRGSPAPAGRPHPKLLLRSPRVRPGELPVTGCVLPAWDTAPHELPTARPTVSRGVARCQGPRAWRRCPPHPALLSWFLWSHN